MKAEERIQNTEDIVSKMLKLLAQMEAKITEQERHSRREKYAYTGLPKEPKRTRQSWLSLWKSCLGKTST